MKPAAISSSFSGHRSEINPATLPIIVRPGAETASRGCSRGSADQESKAPLLRTRSGHAGKREG